LWEEYFAPEAASTRDMIRDGVTSDFVANVRVDHRTRSLAYLVASVDHDVGSAEEVGDGTRMGVEETFPGYGHAVATPVDLDDLR